MGTLTTALGQRKFANVVAAARITAKQSRCEEYRVNAAECQELADRGSELVKQQYEELGAPMADPGRASCKERFDMRSAK